MKVMIVFTVIIFLLCSCQPTPDKPAVINTRVHRRFQFASELTEPLEAFIIPKDKVFVMGDNRDVSVDSREFGPVKTDQITGKMLFAIW
ncbi:MAG: signal peptidase I [Christensenellales bacterium]